MTSDAVRSANRSVRLRSIAVSSSRRPASAERRTSEDSSSALLAPDSSSLGSMPTSRRIPFALLLSSSTAGLNTVVKRVWNGITSLAVSRGRASAKFFGTSSPMIIDSSVATTSATTVDTGETRPSASPADVSGPASSRLSAGSIVYPVSSVVSVMPSWALERWVEVMRSARMDGPSRFSPRSWRFSRSERSRLTSANSLATKRPVPRVRRRPTARRSHSCKGMAPGHRARGRLQWEGRAQRGSMSRRGVVHRPSSIPGLTSRPAGACPPRSPPRTGSRRRPARRTRRACAPRCR